MNTTGGPRRGIRKIINPYNEQKQLIRMSWHKQNTYNLLSAKLPLIDRLTVFQQKWKAKKLLRAYHVPQISEKQFLARHFDTKLPIKMHPLEVRGDLTPIQVIMFGELERRVDCVVFRSMFASSIFKARKFVTDGFVKVNGVECRYPARRLEDGDMITVDPRVVCILQPPVTKKENSESKPESEETPKSESEEPKAISLNQPRPFNPPDYITPWLYIPRYLEVSFAVCSAVLLRSPLVQPKYMEIPSPYPPAWHQLCFDWYSKKKRAQARPALKPELVVNGTTVKLKPKFDRIVRKDQQIEAAKIKEIKAGLESMKLSQIRQKFKAAGNSV